MQSGANRSPTEIITPWICDAFASENFIKYDIQITGTSEKGNGYVGDITFLKVSGIKADGRVKQYSLVLKHGKRDANLRETTPVRLAFEREIFVYHIAVPTFNKFQEDKNLDPIDFLPTCYNTCLYDEDEVIVLENLTTFGYEIHDRIVPMNKEHLNRTLAVYAKWHSLTFAYRDQKFEDFNAKFKNMESVFTIFISAPKFRFCLEQGQTNICKILEECKEFELVEKFKERFKDGFRQTFNKLLNAEEPQSVLLHGDCWNNNIMYKYKDSDVNKTDPEKVVLIDFQFSKIASPVVDLSYHIYSVSSAKELEEFDDLLKTYYSIFSNNLRALGSDPEKVFSYSDLLRHWKKYAVVGYIFSTFVLPFVFLNKADVKDLQDFDENSINEAFQNAKRSYGYQLSSRTVAAVKHLLGSTSF